MPTLTMNLGERAYPITVEHGALRRAGELMNLNRRVLMLTDSGVPAAYAEAVARACAEPHILTLEPGEQNKCPERLFEVLRVMVEAGFGRGDCLVAVGGGVIGDLGGFAAATYMRGITFYNVPTTLLSEVDSSVGGKVAVDFCGYKNIVGTFYQPAGVLIDPDVLETLDRRQFGCGMAEIIKMFATHDRDMFERLEDRRSPVSAVELISAALKIKMHVVEADERESGLRRVLNFGHTVGHAVETISADDPFPLLHGECVGLGMLALTEGDVRRRIERLLHRYDLPTAFRCERGQLRRAILHDKKAAGDGIVTVRVPEIGRFVFERMSADEIIERSGEVISLS